ncbi:DNA methyltransferase [Acinetobacter indicus]
MVIPPYLGSTWQSKEQKGDLEKLFKNVTKNWKLLDYVSGWFIKASTYLQFDKKSKSAFVTTNSISQGQQVPILWPSILEKNINISFAVSNFSWTNLASHNAGVTVVIIGLSPINSDVSLFSILIMLVRFTKKKLKTLMHI